MFEFRCPNCSQKLTSRDDQRGKVSRCPKCKNELTIPKAEEPQVELEEAYAVAPIINEPRPLDDKLFDLSVRQKEKKAAQQELTPEKEEQLLRSLGIKKSEPECSGERQYPWLIDILMYPFNVAGLSYFLILIIFPTFTAVLFEVVPSWITFIFRIPILLIGLIVGAYAFMYLSDCIKDSACGGTRSPEAVDTSVGFGELISRFFNIFACILLYNIVPALYQLFTNRTDYIYWLMRAISLFLLPMALLAVVIEDSTHVLNPFILLRSIFKTFIEYMVLVLIFACVFASLYFIGKADTEESPLALWQSIIIVIIFVYLSIIIAHILGRFYWRNREKLDW